MKKVFLAVSLLLISYIGFSQTIPVTDTLLLNSSLSYDKDGSIVSYQWKQVSGTSIIINNSGKQTAFGIVSIAGNYGFTLTVTDNSGASVTSAVKIVKVDPADNILPVPIITVMPAEEIKLPQKQ